jgi:hypothetical protein
MRVHVELRRDAGRFIARFRKQEGFTGELLTRRKTLPDRTVVYLTVDVEPKQGYPNEIPPGPVLFEPRLIEVFGEDFRLTGWEITPDMAWHVQEWDCTVIDKRPERYRT